MTEHGMMTAGMARHLAGVGHAETRSAPSSAVVTQKKQRRLTEREALTVAEKLVDAVKAVLREHGLDTDVSKILR